MANIYVNNPGIVADVDNMVLETRKMKTAVDDFVALCNAHKGNFTGLTADRLTYLLNDLISKSDEMNAQFGQGATTLGNMVEVINNGDTHGAQILGNI